MTTKTSNNTPPIPLMFTVSGMRGIVGETFTAETIVRYAGVFAFWIADSKSTDRPTIVVARDGRQGGAPLKQLLAASLAAAGCDVIDIDTATTPSAGFTVLDREADAAIVLTASHNPAEWNGLKPITALGSAPSPEQASHLIALYADTPIRRATPPNMGSISICDDAAQKHVNAVIAALTEHDADAIRDRKLKVIVDSVNASGARAAKLLADALDWELIHLHDEPTGVFPHTPEPTRENLAHLSAAVIEHGADIAFAQDPDADRLAIIDETGRYIGEEYTLVLAALRLFEGDDAPDAPAVATNLSTSRMIDDIARKHAARVLRTPVGEANVVAGMRAAGCIIAGEGNGGVIWPAVVPIRDSIGAMALVTSLIARLDQSLSKIVDTIPAYAIVKDKIPVEGIPIDRAITAIRAAYPDATADTQDGLRLDMRTDSGNAWIHTRPSNTEPILRIIAEAPTQTEAQSLADRVRAIIDAL